MAKHGPFNQPLDVLNFNVQQISQSNSGLNN